MLKKLYEKKQSNAHFQEIKNGVLRPLGLKKFQSELYAVVKCNFTEYT
jgi:hypothetical protein